jgi:hypothetical protein
MLVCYEVETSSAQPVIDGNELSSGLGARTTEGRQGWVPCLGRLLVSSCKPSYV